MRLKPTESDTAPVRATKLKNTAKSRDRELAVRQTYNRTHDFVTIYTECGTGPGTACSMMSIDYQTLTKEERLSFDKALTMYRADRAMRYCDNNSSTDLADRSAADAVHDSRRLTSSRKACR